MDINFTPIFEKYHFKLTDVEQDELGRNIRTYRLNKAEDGLGYYGVRVHDNEGQILLSIIARCEKSRVDLSKCAHEMSLLIQEHPRFRLRHLLGERVVIFDPHIIVDFDKHVTICDPKHYEHIKAQVKHICRGKVYKTAPQSSLLAEGEEAIVLSQIFNDLKLLQQADSYLRFLEIRTLIRLTDEMIVALNEIGFGCRRWF
jgi:hypothetical protein